MPGCQGVHQGTKVTDTVVGGLTGARVYTRVQRLLTLWWVVSLVPGCTPGYKGY